jgi:hypothetical protein
MTALDELLRDADVHWAGTYIGLYPTIDQGVAERLAALGPELIPGLIDALSSEHDFAAAHVLLTRLTGIEYEAMPAWNGLEVEIASDGAVHIDPAQRTQLARRWRGWFASEPHPHRLPAPD